MSDSVRREMIAFPTRNPQTIEEIQISTESNLRSVANEEEDIAGEKENLEESIDVDSVVTENTEEDLITTYENIEEQSDFSDSDYEFSNVLENNDNVRKVVLILIRYHAFYPILVINTLFFFNECKKILFKYKNYHY